MTIRVLPYCPEMADLDALLTLDDPPRYRSGEAAQTSTTPSRSVVRGFGVKKSPLDPSFFLV